MIEAHNKCIRVSDTNICPFCFSNKIIKNGTTKTKKQQYICRNCNRRFLDFYTYKAYSPNLNSFIIQFMKEGLGIRSTARILKISTGTLLKRIVFIASEIKQPPIKFNQTYEVDEMRTFIKKKSNLYWLVYALNKETKEIVSFVIGKRNYKR